jgi:hypothetical protein
MMVDIKYINPNNEEIPVDRGFSEELSKITERLYGVHPVVMRTSERSGLTLTHADVGAQGLFESRDSAHLWCRHLLRGVLVKDGIEDLYLSVQGRKEGVRNIEYTSGAYRETVEDRIQGRSVARITIDRSGGDRIKLLLDSDLELRFYFPPFSLSNIMLPSGFYVPPEKDGRQFVLK